MVMHPDDLPAGCAPKVEGPLRHFVGADGGKIENFGKAVTMLSTNEATDIECAWQVANVTRPLHST